MKKFIIIPLITSVLLMIVIVDTMANFSDLPDQNRNANQQISMSSEIDSTSPGRINDRAVVDLNGGSRSALLSMLMIGFTLVGLAGFREDKQEPSVESYEKKRKNEFGSLKTSSQS